MEIKNPRYFGQLLLSKGFRVWFKYMFQAIEGREFVEEALHEGLFDEFDAIYKQDITRSCINVPPRSGKTTQATYFIAYCWAKDAKSNFIYTSYSQQLLGDISRAFVNILHHPIYQAMYDLSFSVQSKEESPVDEFWGDYLKNEDTNTKTTISTKRVVSPAGGVCLFSSIGASITGFGSGTRGAEGFSGALFIDDANKPADIHSEVMRKKVIDYFGETLLSRLNNSDTAIVNIQQRLHVEDLTGFLLKTYDYHLLKRPLVVDDVCQLPSQYTDERLREIKVIPSLFYTQYQQEPMVSEGNIVKRTWWKWYDPKTKPHLRPLVKSYDTAFKEGQENDPSAMTEWAMEGGEHYITDIWEARVGYPDLKRFMLQNFDEQPCPEVLIEDKASGQSVLQELSRITTSSGRKMPVKAMTPGGSTKDPLKAQFSMPRSKLERVEFVAAIIEAGHVHLPKGHPMAEKLVEQFASFPNGAHDDMVDTVTQRLCRAMAARKVKTRKRELIL